MCKFAFSIEIPQSLGGGTQWRMASSAGCPEPPGRPTSSRGLHGLNQHASIGFCAYLPNHDFSRRIQPIDSSVPCTSGIFSNLNLNSKTSASKHHIFLVFAPSSKQLPPSTHKLTHTQCLVNDPPAALLRAPPSLRAPPPRRLPSSRPGLRLLMRRPLPRHPTSRHPPPRAPACSARWLPQLRMSDL